MTKLARLSRKQFIAATVCAILVSGFTAASAGAVDYLGSNPAPPANSGGTCASATSCTFFQSGEASSTPTYTASYDGIITGYSVSQGSSLAGVNTAQLRTFRPLGGGSWLVSGQSAPGTLYPGCCGAITNFLPARVAVKAGDRVGITVHFDGNSAWQHTSAQAGDVVAQVSGVSPMLGDTLIPLNLIATANRYVNIGFSLEHDTDGDGFGDETQDLCPGDPAHGDTACSGYRLGSDFHHPTIAGGSAGCGVPPCATFNTTLGGNSNAAPTAGVIVRWRTRTTGGAADLSLFVMHPDSLTSWSLAGVSDPVSQTGAPGQPATLRSDVRIPIRAGDYIGISSSNGSYHSYWYGAAAGETGYISLPATIGAAAPPLTSVYSDLEILFNADVEPDVDVDGFGDETQDRCPSDSAEQGACPSPVISNFKSKRSRFRVARKGVVISAAKGTTIGLDLSKASSVQYVVSQKLKGRRKGRKCVKRTARNRDKKSCTYYSVVHTFKQTLPAGSSSFAYSGRFKRGSRIKELKPGSYRMTAVPTSSASAVTGASANLQFRVVRR